jgi:hypothetical protein
LGGVISADDPKWIEPFSWLPEVQFARLVALVLCRGGDVQRGRPWRLPLADRVLLVATYWRTNLTLRQVAPLVGVSKSAADRILDHLAPLLAIAPARRPRKDAVDIVDGTWCPHVTAASPPPVLGTLAHLLFAEGDLQRPVSRINLATKTFKRRGRGRFVLLSDRLDLLDSGTVISLPSEHDMRLLVNRS